MTTGTEESRRRMHHTIVGLVLAVALLAQTLLCLAGNTPTAAAASTSVATSIHTGDDNNDNNDDTGDAAGCDPASIVAVLTASRALCDWHPSGKSDASPLPDLVLAGSLVRGARRASRRWRGEPGRRRLLTIGVIRV